MAACSSTQVQFGLQQSILSLRTSASFGGIKTDLSVKSRSQLVCHVKAKERKTGDSKTPELQLTIKQVFTFLQSRYLNHGQNSRLQLAWTLKIIYQL